MAIDFPSTAGQLTDGSFTHTVNGVTWSWDGTTWKGLAGTFPTASATVKGGIKVGNRLTIDAATGVLDADSQTFNGTLAGDLTVDTNVLKVDTAQNLVGIGTATPIVSYICINLLMLCILPLVKVNTIQTTGLEPLVLLLDSL